MTHILALGLAQDLVAALWRAQDLVTALGRKSLVPPLPSVVAAAAMTVMTAMKRDINWLANGKTNAGLLHCKIFGDLQLWSK